MRNGWHKFDDVETATNAVSLPEWRGDRVVEAEFTQIEDAERHPPSPVRDFALDEAGGATILCVTWISFFLILAGVAIDSTNAYRVNAILQSSADTAALAAVQDVEDADLAKAEALKYAGINMPATNNGNMFNGQVLDVERATDFQRGIWDFDTKTFTATDVDPTAVRVLLRRDDVNGNSVGTSFLRVLGFYDWDIARPAIATSFVPDCINDGIVAANAELSANNGFYNGFCLHGENSVRMTSNNFFEDGVVVSSKAGEDSIYYSGCDSNEGLCDEGTMQARSMTPRMVSRLTTDIESMVDTSADPKLRKKTIPSYIPDDQTITMLKKNDLKKDGFDFGTAPPGIYYITGPCQKLDINTGTLVESDEDDVTTADPLRLIENMMIVSDCRLKIAAGMELRNVVLATFAGNGGDGAPAVSIGEGVRLGRDDDCSFGGGVQIWSMGDVHGAANVEMYGVQIVTDGDVHISAQAEGVEGVAIQASGEVKLTSQGSFGLCSGGVNPVVTAAWYRLVR